VEEDTVKDVLEPGPETEPKPETTDEVTGGDLTGPVVNGRYRLFPAQPISELDHPSAQAFVVRDETRPDDPMFARLCDRGTVIRGNMILQLRRLTELQILRPVDWGAVDWPGSEYQKFAMIFPRPEHGPLMASHEAKIPPMSAETITEKVLGPISETLAFLGQRGLTHRAIRPSNIYLVGEGGGTAILGECLIGAPADAQHAIFETVESAMTPPMARGTGFLTDDYYSLGATLLVLSMGYCPVADLSDEKIIAAKMQKGSYAALMAGHKPSFGLRELLRGLLCDDSVQRWGAEELQQWIGGTLRTSVQDYRVEQTERPFRFGKVEVKDVRNLSRVFAMEWSKAETVIRDGEFTKWVLRNIADQSMSESLESVLEIEAEGGKKAPAGRLAARVSLLLDPPAPLRYKGLTLMPSGIGPMLAKAFMKEDKTEIQRIGDCISKGLPADWYASQATGIKIQLETEMAEFKQMQQLLRQTAPGYGIERCLYMFNRALPCLSPIVGDRYLDTLRDLLPTLESIVQERGELPALVDRHLPAFIASRINGNLDRQLMALVDRNNDGFSPKIGMLEIFARMQSNFGPEQLPFLTEWLARELEPTLDRLKSRSRRETVLGKLKVAASGGNLVDLNNVLNNDVQLRRDEGERRQALQKWNATTHEIARLESSEYQEISQRAGWRAASAISGAIAVISVIIMIAV
jgi:hypothetical protein